MSRELQEFYDGQLEPQPDTPVIPVVRRPSNRFEACIRWFPDYFRGGRILELGAGSTLVARSLLAAGVPVDSILLGEYSRERLRHIESTIDDPRLSVGLVDAEDLPPGLGQFDAILMVAVIEHLIDPMAAMTGVRQLLRPGGFVWINTPNIAKWTRRLKLLVGRFPSTAAWEEGLLTYGRSPARLLDEGHLHYFTFRSLRRMLLERCGYSAVVPVPHCESPRVSLPVEHALARTWPTVFSEVSVVAYG
ncbi:MAG: class I SAM-dependent methyltransferase [Actinomycetota bacterium]|nr:class I SAM-dependent methyltransferase [Actinomycetota bacterium]